MDQSTINHQFRFDRCFVMVVVGHGGCCILPFFSHIPALVPAYLAPALPALLTHLPACSYLRQHLPTYHSYPPRLPYTSNFSVPPLPATYPSPSSLHLLYYCTRTACLYSAFTPPSCHYLPPIPTLYSSPDLCHLLPPSPIFWTGERHGIGVWFWRRRQDVADMAADRRWRWRVRRRPVPAERTTTARAAAYRTRGSVVTLNQRMVRRVRTIGGGG